MTSESVSRRTFLRSASGVGVAVTVGSAALGTQRVVNAASRQIEQHGEVSLLLASGKAKPLHPEVGTLPSILHYVL